MIPLYPWCHTFYNPYIGLVVKELFGTTYVKKMKSTKKMDLENCK